MKTLDLNAIQRLSLISILGTVEGPLSRILPAATVLERIRLTDAETKDVTVSEDGKQITYPTSPEWGKVTCVVDDSHALAVLSVLDQWQHFRASDIGWLSDLTAQLRGK